MPGLLSAQVLKFFSKLSSGSGEQLLTRQMFRLGQLLPLCCKSMCLLDAEAKLGSEPPATHASQQDIICPFRPGVHIIHEGTKFMKERASNLAPCFSDSVFLRS